jgi:hypothetical protein
MRPHVCYAVEIPPWIKASPPKQPMGHMSWEFHALHNVLTDELLNNQNIGSGRCPSTFVILATRSSHTVELIVLLEGSWTTIIEDHCTLWEVVWLIHSKYPSTRRDVGNREACIALICHFHFAHVAAALSVSKSQRIGRTVYIWLAPGTVHVFSARLLFGSSLSNGLTDSKL